MVTVARRAAKVLAAVIRRLRDKTDHGIYPTVIEEILRAFYMANAGERIWSIMKNDTRQTFEDSDEVRGGRYFLDALADLVRSGERPEITLVGHSAGAVFVGNFLKHVEKLRADPNDPFPADFKFKNVVFLAPACTFVEFKPVVERHADLFERFRMFTMYDANEAEDKLVSVLYPRSLLYLISGILEKDDDGKSASDRPIVGMERYYARTDVYTQPEIEAVRKFVEERDSARVVWSPSAGGPGMSSGAISHHLFDEDEQVRASMKALISTS